MNFKISDHALADCEFEGSKRFNNAPESCDRTPRLQHIHTQKYLLKIAAKRANFELITFLVFFLTPGILIYVCSSK